MKLQKWMISESWMEFFSKQSKLLENISKELEKEVNTIYPPKKYIFYAFNNLDVADIKVVIIGQDPYFNPHEAMGLAFSVPIGVAIPSSLGNIFKNLVKYKHIIEPPKSGDLTEWLLQGVFLMNASLTVMAGKKNSHKHLWSKFTIELIKYLSNVLNKCVFVAWGADAKKLLDYVDNRHSTIISSHPSGLSCHRPLGNYAPFNDVDHFGLINKTLDKPINWNN